MSKAQRLDDKGKYQPGSLWNFRLVFLLLVLALSLLSCSLPLEKARVHYLEGQKYEARFKTAEALSCYRAALQAAEKEIKRRPSAPAYLIKGLVEIRLQAWEKAEGSFRLASLLGEEKAGDYSKEVSLYGLALSLENQGLRESAMKLYRFLMEKGKLDTVVQAATGRYLDNRLASLSEKSQGERRKAILDLTNMLEKMLKDYASCGYYHYLLSQVYSFEGKYWESFEEAVLARELGLASEKLLRDNDRQIIFCYHKLKQGSLDEVSGFIQAYKYWIKKWNWQDEITPDWRRR
ncbi:MAG: hypothetical protein H5U07_08745 [Candidatus Aminicenantes bacterium]|nr:hypothetical protein [Candidatus Aminicenantes bacterium]